MDQLSDILNELVPKRGDNKSDVARKLGISSQLLGQYMNGGKNPSWEFLLNWYKVFGDNLIEFFEPEVSNNETPPNDNSQKVVLDLSVLLDLLKSAQHEKGRLLDVIDANLTTLASTQQIILAHVKAGHKWEAKKYGGGAEAEEQSILSQLNKFADEYLPDDELIDKNVKGRK